MPKPYLQIVGSVHGHRGVIQKAQSFVSSRLHLPQRLNRHATKASKFAKHQISDSINDNSAIEWAWIAGRIAVTLVVILGSAIFLRGTGADLTVYAATGFVLAYNVVLALWLRATNNVKGVFAVGFVLDNVVTLLAWWGVSVIMADSGMTTDLYLLLFPKLVIGAVRLSWAGAAIYASFWIASTTALSYIYYGPASYDIQQAPLRILFLATTCALAVRLVAKLKSERRMAELLREESDTVAEIGSLVSSSLNVEDVFPDVAKRVCELVKVESLYLASLDNIHNQMQVLTGWTDGTSIPIIEGQHEIPDIIRHEVVATRSAVVLSHREYRMMLDYFMVRRTAESGSANHSHKIDDTRTLLIAPVVTRDEVIALLLVESRAGSNVDPMQVELVSKIGNQIGGSIASAQLHRRTVQLSEEQSLRQQLDAENRQLQKVSEAKSSMIGFVSHELRTPLTSLLAHTGIIARRAEGKLDEKTFRSIRAVSGAATHLNDLISDLLDMSSIEAGKLDITAKEVNLHELITEIETAFDPLLQAKNQQLHITIQEGVSTVHVDARKLTQVLNNLLSNASKYSPDGSRIDVTVTSLAESVAITVRDYGIGISKEDQAKLFTPFFRSNEAFARKQIGTGLGLLVSKGIVEAHGGILGLESNAGKGTIITIHLPKNAAKMSDDLQAA